MSSTPSTAIVARSHGNSEPTPSTACSAHDAMELLRSPPSVEPLVSGAAEDASLRVLVIGGTERTRSLQGRMAEDGIQVRHTSPPAGIRQVVRRPPDLMLLVGGPRCGLGVLKRLRSISTIGIITLGTTDRVEECVQALDAGADDHLSPPFNHDELVARIWAVHRRTAPPSQPLVASEAELPLLIDLARHEVTRAGRRLHLTSTELRLLELLVSQTGVLMTHEVLLRHVWGEGYGTEANYLRVYVAQLRKKLGDSADAPRLIETTPGVGYRWIGSSPPVSRLAEPPVPEPAEVLLEA